MKPAAELYGLDLRHPQVMTVVNVTPDSFYAASRTFDAATICGRVRSAVAEGASIIDIGGCSSRPGADDVSVAEELRRVELGLRCVREVSRDIPVSVDTFRSEVAEMAVSADNRIIINDISAGRLDERMVSVVAEAAVPYIAMHMRGTPATMSSMSAYDDITAEVIDDFKAVIDRLLAAGADERNIMLDPGFGFAKTLEGNYELLGGLDRLCALGYPVVAGISRKSMIYKVLGTTPDESLAGTTALHWELLRQGAAVLRVHDTRAAADAIKIFEKYKSVNDK